MAHTLTYFVTQGVTHTTTFGAATYIYGTGVAQITFGGNPYIIDLNKFNLAQVGIGGATNLTCLSETPILVSSGATAHSGQTFTINPGKIITPADGSYTIAAGDGNHVAGHGKVKITSTTADVGTRILDLGTIKTSQGLYLETGASVELLSESKDALIFIGSLLQDATAINATINAVVEEGESLTILTGANSGQISDISGVLKMKNNSGNSALDELTTFIDPKKQRIDFPVTVNTGSVITAQSGTILLENNSA